MLVLAGVPRFSAGETNEWASTATSSSDVRFADMDLGRWILRQPIPEPRDEDEKTHNDEVH